MTTPTPASGGAPADLNLTDIVGALVANWRVAVATPFLVAALAVGLSYLIKPTFTARTSFLPPQSQQSSASGALASLGALAGLSGAIRNTGDQYVAFVQSRSVADRLLDRFDLLKVYDEKLKHDARITLVERTRASLGKKDGVISIEVDDHNPQRAADIANAYVEELRKLAASLTLSEAQQRREFFESQLKQVRVKLDAAQAALQGSGLAGSAIKVEPKAAVEALARLRAELTTAEVRLQAMRRNLADQAPEVLQQSAVVAALRGEMDRQARAEQAGVTQGGYIGAYREFKYQETLYDLIARQYEIARVDESREGGQVQVIDPALVPERKSKPKRSIFAIVGFGLGLAAAVALALARRRASGA
jgi:uncharacterized protein involved in exopolysaccharide biosynthesis